MPDRRSLFVAAAGLLLAPAVVRAEALMPVKRVPAWMFMDDEAKVRHLGAALAPFQGARISPRILDEVIEAMERAFDGGRNFVAYYDRDVLSAQLDISGRTLGHKIEPWMGSSRRIVLDEVAA
jgi:hypothetical protein